MQPYYRQQVELAGAGREPVQVGPADAGALLRRVLSERAWKLTIRRERERANVPADGTRVYQAFSRRIAKA